MINFYYVTGCKGTISLWNGEEKEGKEVKKVKQGTEVKEIKEVKKSARRNRGKNATNDQSLKNACTT